MKKGKRKINLFNTPHGHAQVLFIIQSKLCIPLYKMTILYVRYLYVSYQWSNIHNTTACHYFIGMLILSILLSTTLFDRRVAKSKRRAIRNPPITCCRLWNLERLSKSNWRVLLNGILSFFVYIVQKEHIHMEHQ